MNDQRITLTPLKIEPLKKPSILLLIWAKIGGYILFFGGLWLGWFCRGVAIGQ